MILRGRGIEVIAGARGTTPVTTRNQVAAILAKTGAGSRAGLIRLVIRVPPPVE